MMQSEIFIGLVGVGALPTCDILGNSKGAYVNVLAFASTAEEFEVEVNRAVADLGLFVIECEDIEPFAQRAAQRLLDDELHELAAEVHKTRQLRFATFHTFDKVDG